MRGDQIATVLNWEFAGSYPPSETLLGGGFDVLDADTDELEEENTVWGRRIRGFIREEVASRGWDQAKIDMFRGNGDRELGIARTEMFPRRM